MMYTENYIFESTAQNKEVREACFVPSQESYNYSIEISDIANFSSSDQKSRDYNYYNQCKNSQFSNNHLYYSPEQYPPSCRKEFCDQSYPNNSKDVFSDYQKDPVNTNPISKLNNQFKQDKNNMECMYKMDNQIYKRFCMPYTHLKENTQMQFLAMGQQSSYADKLYNSDESIDNFSLDTDNSDLNSRKFRKLTLNFDDNDPLITVIPENLVENTRQNKKLNTSSLFRSFSCSPVIQKQNDVSQYKNDEMFEFLNFLDDQNIDIGYYLFDSAPLIDIKSDHCYATKNLINSLSKLKEANRENVQYNLFLNSFCTPPHKNLVRKEKCNLKLLDTYKNRFLRIQKLAIDESSLIFRLITSLVQKVSCVRSSKKDICKKYTRKDISKKLNMRSRFTNIYKKPLRRYNSSLLPANPTELENFSLRQKYFRKCNNVNYISSYLDSFSVQDQNESVLNTKLFNFKKGYNQLDKNSLCYRLLLRSNN